MDKFESDNSDLAWEAFRYLIGEMSLAEFEAFESRLADDQEAREALGTAVQLQAALISNRDVDVSAVVPPRVETGSGLPHASRSESRRSIRWIAVACVAASLAVLMMLSIPTPSVTVGLIDSSDVVDVQNAAVAAMWVSLAEDSTVNVRVDLADASDSLEMEWTDVAVDSLDIPDWMVSAVRRAGNVDEMLPMLPAEEAL